MAGNEGNASLFPIKILAENENTKRGLKKVKNDCD